MRFIPIKVLLEYEKNASFSEVTLSKLLDESSFEKRDKALASEIAYGTLEKLFSINYFLDKLLPKGVKSLAPVVRAILQTAVYQIQYLDRVPDFAAVDEAVKITAKKAPYAKALVNGVLRNYLREKAKMTLPEENDLPSLSVRYNFSQEILTLILSQYGEDTPSILEGLNSRPTSFVYLNPLKNHSTIIEKYHLTATATENSYACEEDFLHSDEFENGEFFVQGRTSSFIASMLDCKEGEVIFDLCAAPGGKTFVAAICAKDHGKITAFDVSHEKLLKIQQNAKRLGLQSIQTVMTDSTVHCLDLIEKADKIICDVPCSGLGIAAKKPEIRYKKSANFANLPKIQLEILENAFSYLKVGGSLLYSTCTLNQAENMDVVNAFLQKKSNCKVQSLSTCAKHQNFCFTEVDGGLTFLPSSVQDGFFGIKLVRIS